MEQYNELDTFEKVESEPTRVESWPTIEEIERRLRKLGCTKEQVKRHLDQVAMSRMKPQEKVQSSLEGSLIGPTDTTAKRTRSAFVASNSASLRGR